MSDKLVTLLTAGNNLAVQPTTQEIRGLLEPELSFTEKKLLYGAAARENGSRISLVDNQIYTYDHRNRLTTGLGFYDRITKVLRRHGYKVVMRDLAPHPKPEIFEPRWERIFGADSRIELRPGQDVFLWKFIANLKAGLPGRFDCPTGWGKSFAVGLIALLLPKVRIHVTSKRVPVIRDRIFPELQGMVPDVGLVGGGVRKPGHRVQLFTFDSLHHSDGKADCLIIDEVQDAAADAAAGEIARYDCPMYGFSATHDMRLDNKDLRSEAMCGPIIYSMHYSEAVKHKMVVPIEVLWTPVRMTMDPTEGTDDPVERKRLGYWRNKFRNQLIAKRAREYPDQQQLITCETIEHALAVKNELPEFTLVYAVNGVKPNDRRYFMEEGIWPKDGLKEMTQERFTKLTKLFERGRLRKAIVTTVWNVGVSMNHLEVVNRADGGGSPINDTQIPGRGSRINEKIGKTKSILLDYEDQFNRGAKQKAANRRSSYAANGWSQTRIGQTEAVKPQYQLWDV